MEDGEKYEYDMLLKHCESLNLLPCTNVYKRIAIESTHILQEEDEKILSLGMSMPPQEKDKEEQKKIEEQEEQGEGECSSYPSSTPNNGNTQIPMNTPSYTVDDDPLCDKIVSNIWEDENDLVELDDPLCSLDDLYLCGDSTHNYDVEFTFDACKYFERGRDKSPVYASMLFKLQATKHYMHWLLQSCCYLFILSYIKFQCIERELDLKVNGFIICGVLHMLSNTSKWARAMHVIKLTNQNLLNFLKIEKVGNKSWI
jgi:hypothetical protein